ncbi:CehA/McbA family metallohydrolase [Streptomyces sp. LP05-1]|uniref:CehA/McbA family metallohydrolase n=1 Tax=Streptomyces pyxinae TaxID=2970734 RepID=A0ABT2CEN3_9ACTN|nr:CehA/McbA family metallohydrolase [Streptomyces sp. LP05-1]MCS0635874.1 CehA/McbA family metallohydrolase [Streptomyces sp. LP05-1]
MDERGYERRGELTDGHTDEGTAAEGTDGRTDQGAAGRTDEDAAGRTDRRTGEGTAGRTDRGTAGRTGKVRRREAGPEPAFGRRAFVAAGAGAVLAEGPAPGLASAPAAYADGGDGSDGRPAGGERTYTVRGNLPPGAPDYVYVPLQVPPGVRELAVSYTYERPPVPAGTPGNALDIGLFDQRGTGAEGFRGWSGGARSEFSVRAEAATPGYLPGPVRPGTWQVVLAPYTVAPGGLAYTLTVTLRFGPPGRTPEPVHPPGRARGRGRAWYRGDCHLHTVHSDGRRTPAEVAAAARAAGLDFINSSEHNTTSAHAAWEGLWGDDLLILTGEEVTTRTGHAVAIGTDPGAFADWRYRARDGRFGRVARGIHRAGGLVVPAHPHAGCPGCAWKHGYAEADAVEVWNGPWTAEDELALGDWDARLTGSGRWLPAMGGSDAHREPDHVGLPQTVVLADELSRAAILAGLRAGRSYVSESAALSVELTATGGRGAVAGPGERLRVAPDTPVTVRLAVTGAAPGCTARLVTDQGVLRTAALPGPTPPPGAGAGTGAAAATTGPGSGRSAAATTGPGTATGAAIGTGARTAAAVVEWTTTAGYAAYVRAEVRHPATLPGLPGAMAAFTNPVFLGRERPDGGARGSALL